MLAATPLSPRWRRCRTGEALAGSGPKYLLTSTSLPTRNSDAWSVRPEQRMAPLVNDPLGISQAQPAARRRAVAASASGQRTSAGTPRTVPAAPRRRGWGVGPALTQLSTVVGSTPSSSDAGQRSSYVARGVVRPLHLLATSPTGVARKRYRRYHGPGVHVPRRWLCGRCGGALVTAPCCLAPLAPCRH